MKACIGGFKSADRCSYDDNLGPCTAGKRRLYIILRSLQTCRDNEMKPSQKAVSKKGRVTRPSANYSNMYKAGVCIVMVKEL